MLFIVKILLLTILIKQINFVKGKICSKRYSEVVYYRSYRKCGFWCRSYYVTASSRRYYTEYSCCPGYAGNVNTGCTPICNPACVNGEQCLAPGHCRCVDKSRPCAKDKKTTNPTKKHAAVTTTDKTKTTKKEKFISGTFAVLPTDQKSNEVITTGTIAVLSIAVGVLLVIVIAFVILWKTGKLNKAKESLYGHFERRRTRQRTQKHDDNKNVNYTKESGKPFVVEEEDEYHSYDYMSCNEVWEIPHKSISFIEKIESGHFADIWKGSYDCKQNYKKTVVAKILKDPTKSEDELLMKAKIEFFANEVGSHTNVLGFIGAVLDNDTLGPMLILEYCEVGTLKNWLQQKKHSISESVVDTLSQFALDIAKGMTYLASNEIVHKSLAARNVLLTIALNAKIGGFGPKKESKQQNNEPQKERIPLRWMAPECMKTLRNANTENDVWSYGIVLWEIFSLGETPYPEIKKQDIIKKVEAGYRMSRPEFCNDLCYKIMQNCWEHRPSSRPTFESIEMELATGENQSEYYCYTATQQQ